MICAMRLAQNVTGEEYSMLTIEILSEQEQRGTGFSPKSYNGVRWSKTRGNE